MAHGATADWRHSFSVSMILKFPVRYHSACLVRLILQEHCPIYDTVLGESIANHRRGADSHQPLVFFLQ